MSKKVLITGGRGFIGRAVSEHLNNYFEIYKPTSKELDLRDQDGVNFFLKKHNFDEVIHCAGQGVSNNARPDAHNEQQENFNMFVNLERCKDLFGRMFFVSSGAVYGKQQPLVKVNEDYFGKTIPTDDYGKGKYAAAKMIVPDSNIYELRVFGCYGMYEDPAVRFISHACKQAIEGSPITIRQNVFFDYLYVHDLARLIRLLIDKPKLTYNSYNVCSGNSVDLVSLAKIVSNISGNNPGIKIEQDGLGKQYSGDNARLLSEIGAFTFTPHETAIKELYDFILAM